jgi:beta-phosphoglucomutase
MLRAVIFDFDGVITDSEILHLRAFNRVLARYDIEISIKDYYRNYLGLSDIDFFNTLIDKKVLQKPAEGIEHLEKEKTAVFEKLAKTEGKIIKGVRDFLLMLSNSYIRMAICSGALLAEIELVLEQTKLRSFFEVIVSAESVKKGKPNPEGLLLTLQKLNSGRHNIISPSYCVVIEDSHWGLEAAKAAGMHSIAVTNSYDADQLAMAEKIVAKLDDLSMDDLRELCN